MKKKKIDDSGNKKIKILFHSISYYYNNDQDMPEDEQEHVKEMIIEGYSSGQLVDSKEHTGQWSITF